MPTNSERKEPEDFGIMRVIDFVPHYLTERGWETTPQGAQRLSYQDARAEAPQRGGLVVNLAKIQS